MLPEQPALYGEDEITDKSQRFLAGELVREQLMRQLGEELPYATTVEIEKFEDDGSAAAHRRGDLGRARRPEGDRDRQGRRAPARDRRQVRACRWNACSAARCSWKPGCACAKAGRTTKRRCGRSATTTERVGERSDSARFAMRFDRPARLRPARAPLARDQPAGRSAERRPRPPRAGRARRAGAEAAGCCARRCSRCSTSASMRCSAANWRG